MTRVLLSPFITTVWTPVVLAIINIIEATLKMFDDDDFDVSAGQTQRQITDARPIHRPNGITTGAPKAL